MLYKKDKRHKNSRLWLQTYCVEYLEPTRDTPILDRSDSIICKIIVQHFWFTPMAVS